MRKVTILKVGNVNNGRRSWEITMPVEIDGNTVFHYDKEHVSVKHEGMTIVVPRGQVEVLTIKDHPGGFTVVDTWA